MIKKLFMDNSISNEKKRLLNVIKEQIYKRKKILLEKLPIIHTINDGIIIRFFDEWKKIGEENIRYIQIKNDKDLDNKTYYFFLPKNSMFDINNNKNIETIICLEGKIELHFNNKIKLLNSYNKLNIPQNTNHYGIAIENTYLIVSYKN